MAGQENPVHQFSLRGSQSSDQWFGLFLFQFKSSIPKKHINFWPITLTIICDHCNSTRSIVHHVLYVLKTGISLFRKDVIPTDHFENSNLNLNLLKLKFKPKSVSYKGRCFESDSFLKFRKPY